MAKLDEFGVEALCDELMSGGSIGSVSRRVGVTTASVLRWIDLDPDRATTVHNARVKAATIWDELAEDRIIRSVDQFELAKARELAHHYRWRAKCMSPRLYGDRSTQEHTGANGGAISIAALDFKGLSDAELAQMHHIITKSARSGG